MVEGAILGLLYLLAFFGGVLSLYLIAFIIGSIIEIYRYRNSNNNNNNLNDNLLTIN